MWKTLRERFDSPDSYISLALGLAVVIVIGMIAFNYFKARSQTATSTPTPDTTQEKQQKQEGSTGLPTQHTVQSGETLWSIAETYYKSGYNWVDIQKANNIANPDMIEVGQTLTIPQAAPIQAQAGEVSSATTDTAPKKHTVMQGDNLWTIAAANYGTGYKWTAIAKANNLPNPNLIYPGIVLTLP